MNSQALQGYGVADYQEMFDLDLSQFKGRLLEFSCGLSSLNRDMTRNNQQCISCDDLFKSDEATLLAKIKPEMDARLMPSTNLDSPDMLALIAKRKHNIQQFFADYSQGLTEGRYLPASNLLSLFSDFYFDIALCSHYLFGDASVQDLDSHISTVTNLARIANEVRIYPLIDSEGQPSALLGPILLALQQANYGVEVKSVNCSFEKQENAMLRIWAHQCDL